MLNKPSNLPIYPEKEFKDTITEWVDAGIAGIPVIGGSAAKIFGIMITPRIEEKKEQFLRDVASYIAMLSREYEELKIENLRNNDTFIKLIIEITQKAYLTSDNDKRKLLRNAIVQGTLSKDLSEIKINEYSNSLDWINYFHLKILRYFNKQRYTISKRRGYFVGKRKNDEIIEDQTPIEFEFGEMISNDLFSETERIITPHLSIYFEAIRFK